MTTWLASYPRSGNTLIRRLVHIYFFGPPACSGDIAARIPSVGHLAPDAQPPSFCKTHVLYSSQHPHLSAGQRAILVVRNPRDVLLSNINYMRFLGLYSDRSDLALAEDFILNHGSSHWITQGYGSLPGHLASWLQAPIPKCLVTYESLVMRPSEVMRRLLAFLGEPVDEDRLEQAVALSSFAAMRRMEDQELGDGHRPRFINRGKCGDSLDRLAAGLDLAFDRAFAPLLAELGYASVGLARETVAGGLSGLVREQGLPLTAMILPDRSRRAEDLVGLSALFSDRANLLIADGKSEGDALSAAVAALDRVVMIGEGQGALTALRLARQQPERVAALVLADLPEMAEGDALLRAIRQPVTLLFGEESRPPGLETLTSAGALRCAVIPEGRNDLLRHYGGQVLEPILLPLLAMAGAEARQPPSSLTSRCMVSMT